VLNEGQPNFARCLAVSWAGTLYVHFEGSCPLTEFCQVQNSLCVQVLHSRILAALLHDTRAAGVSQTLWHGTRNGITELSRLVIFNRGLCVYSKGGRHVGHRLTFYFRLHLTCNLTKYKYFWRWFFCPFVELWYVPLTCEQYSNCMIA